MPIPACESLSGGCYHSDASEIRSRVLSQVLVLAIVVLIDPVTHEVMLSNRSMKTSRSDS